MSKQLSVKDMFHSSTKKPEKPSPSVFNKYAGIVRMFFSQFSPAQLIIWSISIPSNFSITEKWKKTRKQSA